MPACRKLSPRNPHQRPTLPSVGAGGRGCVEKSIAGLVLHPGRQAPRETVPREERLDASREEVLGFVADRPVEFRRRGLRRGRGIPFGHGFWRPARGRGSPRE